MYDECKMYCNEILIIFITIFIPTFLIKIKNIKLKQISIVGK